MLHNVDGGSEECDKQVLPVERIRTGVVGIKISHVGVIVCVFLYVCGVICMLVCGGE